MTIENGETGLSARTKINAAITKLATIEDNATGDQTGAEIVAAIDSELGGVTWQGGGGSGGATEVEVKTFVGEMVSGNTESLISVTYQSGDQTLDFSVNTDLSQYDNSSSNFLSSTAIGTTVQAFDADTLKADVSDNLTVGYTSDSFDGGTISSGTFTPDPANSNIQHYINNGAHTLAPPALNCSMMVDVVNGASAGTITTGGFTHTEGSFDTTNGNAFRCSISRNDGRSLLVITALQ